MLPLCGSLASSVTAFLLEAGLSVPAVAVLELTVREAGFALTEVHLPLPLKCWMRTSMLGLVFLLN